MGAPLQVGVTGGIGSGKSTVCKLFACLGISIYEADTRAKWLTNNDPEMRQAIVALLGPDAYNAEGAYNTSYVASRVFNNADLLKSLNGIVHPAVGKDTDEWVKRHAGKPYVIKEAAIMNRAGENNTLDFVIVVDAPQDLRLKRILQRDRRPESEIKAIMERQVSDEARRQVADFVVVNDENTALIPQVLELHKRFLEISKR